MGLHRRRRAALSMRAGWARLLLPVMLVTGLTLTGSEVSAASAPTSPTPPVPTTTAASPTSPPATTPPPALASPTPLPTVQVDGVVWTQAVIGSTVYVGGRFTTASSPEGAAPPYAVPRANVLAYDLHTGELRRDFRADTDAQVMVMKASPDGRRLYVGGDFTTIAGVQRWRVAALDVATGAVEPRFTPDVDAKVRAITVTPTAVYLGGGFTKVRKVPRQRLAAVTPAGVLLDWAPAANNSVNALQATPDGRRIVVGGAFNQLNGVKHIGLAAVDAVSGVAGPFDVAFYVRNGKADISEQAAITTLTTDGTAILGGAYSWNGGGTFEGVFSAASDTGKIQWMADCHGDTYSVFAQGPVVYQVGHWHSCLNIGGFDELTPPRYYRAAAMYNRAVGLVLPNSNPYKVDFSGLPGTRLLPWLPEVEMGMVTGQNQGPWHVTGNEDYVVLGGEFPRVAGIPQKGLTRFRVSRPS